jgi:membrane-bound serine protease (ClpP class)
VSFLSNEGPYLTATLKDSHADSRQVALVREGDKGIARTPLRPAGRVLIDGELVDVVADNEFIDKGEEVIVSEIKGNRIIVSRQRVS